MRVLPLAIISFVFLFFAGLIAPRKSKRLERWIQSRLLDGKRLGRRRAGWVGDWTARSLEWGQKLVDTALRSGRRLREMLRSVS